MADDEMTAEGAPVDPGALIRSRQYRVILVFAAVIGVVVSLVAWAFLELVHGIQVGVYEDLPGDLGFDSVPWWWPLPWLAIAGLLTAMEITRLPGTGGHVPANGLPGWRSNAADRAAGCARRCAGDAGIRPRAGAGGATDRARDGPGGVRRAA